MIALGGSATTLSRPTHSFQVRSKLKNLSDEDLLNALHIAEGDYRDAADIIAVGLVSGRQVKKEIRRRGLQGEVGDIRKRGQNAQESPSAWLETVKAGTDTR